MQRQRILERCKWEFYRVRASAFYSNPNRALSELWRMLEERGIMPSVKADGREPPSPSVRPDVALDSDDVDGSDHNNGGMSETEASADEAQIQIGDTVSYINEDSGEQHQAKITMGTSNPDLGVINASTPVARALLGAKVGQVVVAYRPVGSLRLKVIGIN